MNLGNLFLSPERPRHYRWSPTPALAPRLPQRRAFLPLGVPMIWIGRAVVFASAFVCGLHARDARLAHNWLEVWVLVVVLIALGVANDRLSVWRLRLKR